MIWCSGADNLIYFSSSTASTFTSVRSLRYVIYPVQVLFKSCKPVPVMLFGLVLGKKYSIRKYVNVIIITVGGGLSRLYAAMLCCAMLWLSLWNSCANHH